jgi:Flp pilus assembly protein TadG
MQMHHSNSSLVRAPRTGRVRHLLTNVAGTAAIEAAIALPILLSMVGGVFEFGRYYWTRNSIQTALEETARMVMISGTTSQSTVQTYLRGKVTAYGASSVNVTVNTSTASSVTYATIQAQYTFNSIFSYFIPGLASKALTTSVKVPVIS